MLRALLHSGIPSTRASQRQYVVTIYSCLAIVSLGVFGVFHLVGSQPVLGLIELSGACIVAVNALILRWRHNITLASAILLLAMLVLLVIMIITGGTDRTGELWCFMFPVGAFFLMGKKYGALWMGGLIAAIVLLAAAEATELIATAYSFAELRQLIFALIVVAIGVYAYEVSREMLGEETATSKQETKEEKVKASAVIDNIDEGVVATDTQERVVLINPAAEAMLGWSAAELLGRRFIDVVPMKDAAGNDIPPESRPLHNALRNHSPSVITTAFYQRKDGTSFPAAVSGLPIMVDDVVRGSISTFRDITEEQAINRTKSEFIALASHQLRTPLSAINWVSELLLHGDAGKIAGEQRTYIEQIYQSNRRMSALVDAMLTASSLELGSLPSHPEPLEIGDLAHDLLTQQLRQHASRKKFTITENYDPITPVHDRDIIKMILANILANAVKYTPARGKIHVTIRASRKQLPHSQSRNNFLIEVTDTGAGIPKNAHSKIFTKLYRAANVKQQDTDGTGLGLYIAKAAVESCGGSIWFTSIEGKGSTFSVLLPLQNHKRATAEELE